MAKQRRNMGRYLRSDKEIKNGGRNNTKKWQMEVRKTGKVTVRLRWRHIFNSFSRYFQNNVMHL